MVRPFSIITMVIAIALSSACATKKSRPVPESAVLFNTSITTEGGKFFVYRLKMPERDEGAERGRGATGMKGGRPGEQRGQDRSPAKDGRNKDVLKQRVDLLMAQNRYCRDGYFVLEQTTNYNALSLRGECREGANSEDRIRFPNPI
ncbi:MAG: hypothetical protein ACI9JM_002123 [Halioglobus sp.]|jgi:hypothetical protein